MTSSFYNGMSGIKTHQFGIDTWANNIANINTVGYRSSTPEFKDIFTAKVNEAHFAGMDEVGVGVTAQTTAINESEGYLTTTDRSLDFAIQGDGWFSTTAWNDPAQTLYTRAGNFSVDANGSLITDAQNFVLGASSPNITFNKDGTATVTNAGALATNLLDNQKVAAIKLPSRLTYPAQSATDSTGFLKSYETDNQGRIMALFDNGKQVQVAQLAISHFQNDQGLQRNGDNDFSATKNSGQAFLEKDKSGHVLQVGQILTKTLEMSNVSAATALTELIIMQKGFDASAKSITTSDQMIQKAINLKNR